jgi:hypothetical protein
MLARKVDQDNGFTGRHPGKQTTKQLKQVLGFSGVTINKALRAGIACGLIGSSDSHPPRYFGYTTEERDAHQVRAAQEAKLEADLRAALTERGLREDDIDNLLNYGINNQILLALVQGKSFTYGGDNRPVAVDPVP